MGYAAGGILTKYGMFPQRAVMATTDGGVHWAGRYQSGGSAGGGGPSTSSGGPFAEIDFPAPNLGYALLGGCSMGANGPCDGTLWVSRDGGRTWADTGEQGMRLAVASAEQPWMVGGQPSGGAVALRSSNGGRSWEAVAQPSSLDISMLASGGFVFAQTAAGDFESADSGDSWVAAPDPGLQVLEQDQEVMPAVLLASGLAVVDLGGQLWVSHNGGRSGVQVDVPGTGTEGVGGVAFSSDRQGMVVGAASCDTKDVTAPGGPGVVAVTGNGGTSWAVVGTLSFGVDGLALGKGVAVAVGAGCGTHAQVATSTDGGRQWQLWSLPDGLGCDAVSGAGDTLALGCFREGSSGQESSEILVSENGAKSWDLYSLAAPDALNGGVAVAVAGSGQLWADGPPGALWHSTDGGQSWKAVAVTFPPASARPWASRLLPPPLPQLRYCRGDS